MIPQHFIDDLIARADIARWSGGMCSSRRPAGIQSQLPVPRRKNALFHRQPVTRASITASAAARTGRRSSFLMEYDHMTFVEAVETLAGMLGIEVPREEQERPAQRYDELFELMRRVECTISRR